MNPPPYVCHASFKDSTGDCRYRAFFIVSGELEGTGDGERCKVTARVAHGDWSGAAKIRRRITQLGYTTYERKADTIHGKDEVRQRESGRLYTRTEAYTLATYFVERRAS